MRVGWPKSAVRAVILAIPLLVCISCAGVSVGADIGYSPPFLPIKITVDTHGDISIHGSANIVTPIGTFSVGMNVTKGMQSQPGETLLIIRHRENGSTVDTVYAVQDQQIAVVMNGRVALTVTNGRVFVDASKAQVLSITISSTATPSPSSPPTVAGQSYSDPLTSADHSSGWPSGPYYPPPGDAVDPPIFCGFQADGYHIGDSYSVDYDATCKNNDITFGNGTISVTAKLTEDDPVSRANANLAADNGYGIFIRADSMALGSNVGFSITPAGAWCTAGDCYNNLQPANPAIRRGLNVDNTLTIRASGSVFQFYVNGTYIGREVAADALPEGEVGFAVDQYNNATYKNLVIKP
jgi:hypothetical protein